MVGSSHWSEGAKWTQFGRVLTKTATWSGGEVVNTLGFQPSIHGFEPRPDYHIRVALKETGSPIDSKSTGKGFDSLLWCHLVLVV